MTRWIRTLGLGVLAALTVAPFIAFTDVTARADENAANIRRLCEFGNRQDAKQKLLWNGVIALTANNPSLLTPAQQAEQLRQFRAILDDTYRPQDCG